MENEGKPEDVYSYVMYLQDFSGRIEGLKVDAIDTTGAGDAFVAGILSQLASHTNLIQVTFLYQLSFFSS